MHKPMRFSDEIEPLVQFIEDTDPSRILEETAAQLRGALSIKKLLTASALAVTRSSDLPPGHHGGPLHPLVGIHAIRHTVERVSGERRFLPILQHVALSNKHIHHPGMGPYMLPDFEPVDAGGVDATKKRSSPPLTVACTTPPITTSSGSGRTSRPPRPSISS